MHPIIWLADLDTELHASGGKTAKQLAKLTQAKFPIIPGFIITSTAYQDFLQENNLDQKIRQLLSTIAVERPDSLMQGERHILELFKRAELSETFIKELKDFYLQLGRGDVCITLFETEQQEKKHSAKHTDTFDSLITHIRDSWAQLYSGNALWRRKQFNLNHMHTNAEIFIQKIITADKKGTIVTIEPHTHAKDKIIITTLSPHEGDTYILSKKNLSILDRHIKHKDYAHKLTQEEIHAIAKLAKRIDSFLFFPQEISWAIEGNKLYITDIKQISALPQHLPEPKRRLPIARGKGITARIGTGFAHIIHNEFELRNIKEHDVLIISEVKTKHIPYLRKSRGVIVESGHPHTEIAVLLQKHAIPAVFQVKHAARQIKNGHLVTIHGGKGEIYRGGFL